MSVLLFACSGPQSKDSLRDAGGSDESESKTPITDLIRNETEVLLQDQLDAKKASWAQNAPLDIQEKYAKNQEAIELSGILGMALRKGDRAPNFILKNAEGEEVSLYENLLNGPVILTWYRGGWCPYCNMTLNYLSKEMPKIKKEGAQLFALTPEVPDSSISTKEKHDLKFEVLSDLGNKIAKDYGIVYQLSPEVASIFQDKFDLHAYNGDSSDELPLSATYIIDQEGVIQYAFLDVDYRKRAEPRKLIKELKKLKSSN